MEGQRWGLSVPNHRVEVHSTERGSPLARHCVSLSVLAGSLRARHPTAAPGRLNLQLVVQLRVGTGSSRRPASRAESPNMRSVYWLSRSGARRDRSRGLHSVRGLNRSRGSPFDHAVVVRGTGSSAMLTSEAIRLVHRQEQDHGCFDSHRLAVAPTHARGHAHAQVRLLIAGFRIDGTRLQVAPVLDSRAAG